MPLLTLCEPGFTVSSRVELIVCPNVGVVKPAGASVWDCCPTRTIAAVPIIEMMAVFLCFNLVNLLRTWWVLGKLGFFCLDRTLERIIPDRANNVRFFFRARWALHSRGNILALRSVFSPEGNL
jgi:hypothetical protein